MKRIFIFGLICFLALVSCSTKEIDISKLKIYSINDLDLNKISFDKEIFKNQLVIIHFWTTWSEESVEVLNQINDICKQSYDNISFFVINLDADREKVKEFLMSNNYLFNTYYDYQGLWTKNYYVRYVPYTLIYDKSGSLVKEYKASDYDDYEGFKDLIKARK